MTWTNIIQILSKRKDHRTKTGQRRFKYYLRERTIAWTTAIQILSKRQNDDDDMNKGTKAIQIYLRGKKDHFQSQLINLSKRKEEDINKG